MTANITLLPSSRVPLIYEDTTLMSNEWYRFFWNIYGFTGTGVIPANKGGTGYATYTNGQLLIGNAAGALTANTLTPSTGIGITNGDGSITIANTGVTSLLASAGISVSSATGAVTVANTGVLSFSAGTTGFTPSTATTGVVALAGILNVANGGTGQTTYTNGQLLIGNTTGNTLSKATLTAGANITITNGPGTITIAATGSTGVASVTGTAPIVSSGGANPAISLAANYGDTQNPYASKTANYVLAAPNGSAGVPTFRALVTADVTGLGTMATQNANSVTITGGSINGTTIGATTQADITGNIVSAFTKFVSQDYYAQSVLGGNLRTSSGTSLLNWDGGGSGNVTINGGLLANPANKNISIAPTGTGTATINPATAGTINNMVIGGTTPLAITGTTITATTFSGSGASLTSIPNSALTNSTISGVALGNSLYNLTAGTGVSFSTGTTYNGSAAITINATGSGGTVTSVSVTSANGFAGTVATATTTPAITISTSITGILKGNATAISAATTGTDYAPGTSANTSGLVYSTTTTGALTTATGAQVATALGSTNISGNAANVTGIVLGANGGTGVANTGFTFTMAGNVSHAGSFTQTFTATGNTSVTLPTSGTLLTTTGSGSSLTFGTGTLSLAGNVTHSGSFTQTFTATGNTSVTLPTTGTLATLAGTETLTNKRVTPRVSTTTSSATPTINTDNVDMYGLTAQAANITSFTTNLSGTPTDGQKLWIYIVGTAARTITWGAKFEASTVALPTTTVTTNRLDVGFVWNAASSVWRCVAVA